MSTPSANTRSLDPTLTVENATHPRLQAFITLKGRMRVYEYTKRTPRERERGLCRNTRNQKAHVYYVQSNRHGATDKLNFLLKSGLWRSCLRKSRGMASHPERERYTQERRETAAMWRFPAAFSLSVLDARLRHNQKEGSADRTSAGGRCLAQWF